MNIKKILLRKNSLKSLFEESEKNIRLSKINFEAFWKENFFIVTSQIKAITIDKKIYPNVVDTIKK